MAQSPLTRVPIYVVLFDGAVSAGPYAPLVAPSDADVDGVTVPHGLDREVVPGLPALWYCLHLPNVLFELESLPAAVVKQAQILDLGHHILLVPLNAFDQDHVGAWLARGVPVLSVCPDDRVEDAAARSASLGFLLPPVAYSDLSDESLVAHWRAIHQAVAPDAEYLGGEPRLSTRWDYAPTDLPRRWLERQLTAARNADAARIESAEDTSLDDIFARSLWDHVVLSAVARLEREEVAPADAETRMPATIADERARLRIPVTLALPGVAPAYARNAYNATARDRIEALPATDPADTWTTSMKGAERCARRARRH